MQRYVFLIRLSAIAVVILLTGLSGTAAAQATVTWGEPVNLSNSGTNSMHPAIVADAYGYVHVLWSEDVGGRDVAPGTLGDAPNAIMYRRWDGQAWTEPVDVLAVAGDTLADYVATTIDSENRLHVVWTGLSRLYYSTAHATDAGSVSAWSPPQVIAPDSARSSFESDVAVDSQGNVHIVYATKASAGVFHITAPVGTTVWTAPVRISDYLRTNETAFKDVRLVIDAKDRLHAAWGTVNPNGYDQAVYYARSEPGGLTWDAPVMMADASTDTAFTGLPSLLSYGTDALLLIHVAEKHQGRTERASIDAGKTWSEPRLILPSMEGVNGFLIPLLDGGGNLHLIIDMRPSADQRVGIYYAPRAGRDWSPILPVAVDEPFGPSAHYADAAVRFGNEIHVVWTAIHPGEIWYVKGSINGVASIAAQSVPPEPAVVAMPVKTPRVPRTTTTQPIVTSESAANKLPAGLLSPTAQASATWTPIAFAIAPVLLLLTGVAVSRIRRR